MRGLRITGGVLGGRVIKVPRDDVRPTQDMVREALFSILGELTVGCRFLDLYAGSGAVGLEAWSRGADYVCWVDRDNAVLKVLKDNVENLCDVGTDIIRGDVEKVLKDCVQGEAPFDIIFADPPYKDIELALVTALDLMRAIEAGGVMGETGLFIMEMPKRSSSEAADDWKLIDERSYGRTKLCFYRRTE